MKSILRKVFDCTLGALWRLYVEMIVDVFIFDRDIEFLDWVRAIFVTVLFICAIYVACYTLLMLVIITISFPLPVICCIIGITVICILPRLALKSYKSSKAKTKAKATRASFRKAVKTARSSKKGFNQ